MNSNSPLSKEEEVEFLDNYGIRQQGGGSSDTKVNNDCGHFFILNVLYALLFGNNDHIKNSAKAKLTSNQREQIGAQLRQMFPDVIEDISDEELLKDSNYQCYGIPSKFLADIKNNSTPVESNYSSMPTAAEPEASAVPETPAVIVTTSTRDNEKNYDTMPPTKSVLPASYPSNPIPISATPPLTVSIQSLLVSTPNGALNYVQNPILQSPAPASIHNIAPSDSNKKNSESPYASIPKPPFAAAASRLQQPSPFFQHLIRRNLFLLAGHHRHPHQLKILRHPIQMAN